MPKTTLTALTKSVTTLAAKLTKEGYEVEVSRFVDDTRGGGLGGSYVSLYVSGETVHATYEFYSKYGGLSRNTYSGESMKWSEMKKAVLADIALQVSRGY